MAFLDDNGVLYLWNKIKAAFVAKDGSKVLSDNNYTTTEKEKLAGIASGANKTTVENVLTSTSTTNALSAAQGKALKALIDAKGTGNGDMLKSVYDTDGDGIVDNSKKVNGHTVESDVPSGAKFTDTVYTHPTSAGNKHIPTGGASGQILRWSASGTAVWGEDKDTTYSEATTENSGLLAAADKAKLDGIEAGAQVNVVRAITSPNPGNSYSATFFKTSGEAFTVPTTGTGYAISATFLPVVTAGARGAMTPEDKAKLDALPTGATIQSTYATKAEIVGMYKYKGSVNNASGLPASPAVGDVYNIVNSSVYGGAGANVAWNGEAWDSLGEIFTISAITNAQIDTICV
jgi:hypothetical protein